MAMVRRMAVSFVVALRSRSVGGRGSLTRWVEQYPRGVRAVKTARSGVRCDRESATTSPPAAPLRRARLDRARQRSRGDEVRGEPGRTEVFRGDGGPGEAQDRRRPGATRVLGRGEPGRRWLPWALRIDPDAERRRRRAGVSTHPVELGTGPRHRGRQHAPRLRARCRRAPEDRGRDVSGESRVAARAREARLPAAWPHRLQGRAGCVLRRYARDARSEEHTSELQSLTNLVCRLLLEKKKKKINKTDKKQKKKIKKRQKV